MEVSDFVIKTNYETVNLLKLVWPNSAWSLYPHTSVPPRHPELERLCPVCHILLVAQHVCSDADSVRTGVTAALSSIRFTLRREQAGVRIQGEHAWGIGETDFRCNQKIG